MRREGLEPSRPRGHGLLRPACLPVPPSARWSCSSLRTMRREGLEPSRPSGPGLLRPVCLPISPPARRSRGPHQNAQGGIRTHTPSRARPSRGRFSAVPAPSRRSIFLKGIGMTGFEPATSCSPSTSSHQAELHPAVHSHTCVCSILSGRQDSGLRPPDRHGTLPLGYALLLLSPGCLGGVISPAGRGRGLRPRVCVPVARKPIYRPYLLVNAITRSASEAGALTRLGYIPKSAREELNLQPPHS